MSRADDRAWERAEKALASSEGEVYDPTADRFEHLPKRGVEEPVKAGDPPSDPRAQKVLKKLGLL